MLGDFSRRSRRSGARWCRAYGVDRHVPRMAEVSVVTFHILQAMTNARLTPQGLFDFWTPVGDMIRMPLMMFVAVCSSNTRCAKVGRIFQGQDPTRDLALHHLAHVYSVYWYVKPSAFDQRTLTEVFLTTFVPGSHLWFLQSLFLYYILVYFLLKRGIWLTLAVAFAVALTTPLFGPEELKRVPLSLPVLRLRHRL